MASHCTLLGYIVDASFHDHVGRVDWLAVGIYLRVNNSLFPQRTLRLWSFAVEYALIDTSTKLGLYMKKRDAAYYRRRLEKEFPKIFADLSAGRLQSVRQAAAKAGLIHLPNRLVALKRDWTKATPGQRSDFLKWIKSSRIGLKRRPSALVADRAGKLMPRAITFIHNWTKTNRATPGKIMRELGYSNYDYRLAQSLKGRAGLPPDVLAVLGPWLTKQGF